MGEGEIKDKLVTKLQSVPKTEEDVVYILSRVRKILEIDNYPEDFSILNFYCNLTLHARITRPPKVIVAKLKKIKEGTEDYDEALFDITHGDLHKQLDLFCKTHGIESFYATKDSEAIKKFNDLLLKIWSHTPIRIEYVEAFDLVIKVSSDGFFSVTIGPAKQ